MRFQIILFDGFDELDAVGPYEVLRMAASAGASFEVSLVSLRGRRMVTAANGLTVRAQRRADPGSEVTIVPGGGWVTRAPQGVRAEVRKGDIPRFLDQLHGRGKIVATVCTGTMLAARFLKGRPAVTHHLALSDLKKAGARIVRARIVDDGDFVSAGGVTSGIDLGLWLVERFAGRALAHRVAGNLEYKRQGPIKRIYP